MRAGSMVLAAVSFVVWQFETGRAGIGERPALASALPGSDGATPGMVILTPSIKGTATEDAGAATSIRLDVLPPDGTVGIDEPCPTGVPDALGGTEFADRTVCAVHLDLAGAFATTRAPGRFGIWCESGDHTFRPATVLHRDVDLIGTATTDYRTVLVLQVAPDDPAGLPVFATLRRDPSATGGWGPQCPTLQELGTGLAVEHRAEDPYVPTLDGVPLLLSSGGVAVRPTTVGVELVRLTPEIPVETPQSPDNLAGGGE